MSGDDAALTVQNSINIIYEDNHLLVVEKPRNILVQADVTGDADLLSILKNDLKERYGKPGAVYLGLVHRLDRPVGGTMVFAKTSKAASRLSAQIRSREMTKTYLAVIHGAPETAEGVLCDFLAKDRERNLVKTVDSEEAGKEAVLEYVNLKSAAIPNSSLGKLGSGILSLVKIKLITGRAHQIRVQFASRGCPLWGDSKYGIKNEGKGEIALWSYGLKLSHPTKKDEMEFMSIPESIYPWSLFSDSIELQSNINN